MLVRTSGDRIFGVLVWAWAGLSGNSDTDPLWPYWSRSWIKQEGHLVSFSFIKDRLDAQQQTSFQGPSNIEQLLQKLCPTNILNSRCRALWEFTQAVSKWSKLMWGSWKAREGVLAICIKIKWMVSIVAGNFIWMHSAMKWILCYADHTSFGGAELDLPRPPFAFQTLLVTSVCLCPCDCKCPLPTPDSTFTFSRQFSPSQNLL